MEILLAYLLLISLNCLLTIYLYRETKKEADDQHKLKIRIMSWSLIAINFIMLIVTLGLIYTKKVQVNYSKK